MLSNKDLKTSIVAIINAPELKDLIKELVVKDSENGRVIGKSIFNTLKPISVAYSKILENKEIQMQFALELHSLKEAIDTSSLKIQSIVSPYISYSETIALRKADLESFARNTGQEFMDHLLDGISSYFDEKRDVLFERIEQELNSKERLKDTLKPFGKIAKKGFDKIGFKTKSRPWNQLFIEKILEDELSEQKLKANLKKIVDNAKASFESKWKKKAEKDPPDLRMMRILALNASTANASGIGFNMEVATPVLATGIGAALAGTFGLAAGWHTINYALINVFPPAAIIALLLTAVTFKFTGKHAQKSRKESVEKVIQQYYAHVLGNLYKQGINEFGGLTMPQQLHKISSDCIDTVLKHWEKQISGNLDVSDYRLLARSISDQLEKMNVAKKLIQQEIETLKSTTVTPTLKSDLKSNAELVNKYEDSESSNLNSDIDQGQKRTHKHSKLKGLLKMICFRKDGDANGFRK